MEKIPDETRLDFQTLVVTEHGYNPGIWVRRFQTDPRIQDYLKQKSIWKGFDKEHRCRNGEVFIRFEMFAETYKEVLQHMVEVQNWKALKDFPEEEEEE